MLGIAKTFDIGLGVCPCHKSPVPYATMMTVGAVSVRVNSLPAATLLTIGMSTCGHPTVALTCSWNVRAQSLGVHRLLDVGTNCGPYVMTTASWNVRN
jgi:hypothetical protein